MSNDYLNVSTASFWTPDYLSDSAWLTHAPFAFWLAERIRPRCFVELGTHTGFSFFAFCQAIDRLNLGTTAFAIDTWKGDEHAGVYGDDVYAAVSAQNGRYASFATLMRATFAEALAYFEDGSIDLLHIDGRHLYDDVKTDYETWLPKLTERAVVIFHDTNVREREFGVWKFFEEISARHPHFAFVHGYGLGVLCPGGTPPEVLEALLGADVPVKDATRSIYAALGQTVLNRYAASRLRRSVDTLSDPGIHLSPEILTAIVDQSGGDGSIARIVSKVASFDASLPSVTAENAGLRDEVARLEVAKARIETVEARHRDELRSARAELDSTRAVLQRAQESHDAAAADLQGRVTRLIEAQRALREERDGISRELAEARQETHRQIVDRARLQAASAGVEAECARLRIASAAAEAEFESLRKLVGAAVEGLSTAEEIMVAAGCVPTSPNGASWGGTLLASALFDEDFYLATYPDVAESGEDAAAHYTAVGWREGRNPSAGFDTAYYLERYPDVAEADVDPLLHYTVSGAAEGRSPRPLREAEHAASGIDPGAIAASDPGTSPGATAVRASVYFDPIFYARQAMLDQGTDAIEHYLASGWTIRLDPSPFFSTSHYLGLYDDVLSTGAQPLLHYLAHGYRERRSPSSHLDIPEYVAFHRAMLSDDEDVAAHCLRLYGSYDWKRAPSQPWMRSHPSFDARWYVASAPDLVLTEASAFDHFMLIGWREGRDPNAVFDTDWYLARYPDVAASGANPLVHYVLHGWREQRQPSPFFDVAYYLETNLDVAAASVEPLGHYLSIGEREGRNPHARFDVSWYRTEYPGSQASRWGVLSFYAHIGRLKGQRPHPRFPDTLVSHPDEGEIALLDDAGHRHRAPPAVIERYASWLEVNGATDVDRAHLLGRLDRAVGTLPTISVVMPAYNSDPAYLAAAIESVQAQVYGDWELCICDDASPSDAVSNLVGRYADEDRRIRWIRSATNENISGASNRAAALATGDVIALLDHDDLLHPHALGEFALLYAADPTVDIAYSDDDKIDMEGRRYDPQFKPDWSPVLLLSFMYVSHLLTFRRSLFEAMGGFRLGFEGSQDYDLMLRMSEKARSVRHVPKILYHWRAVLGSTALSGDTKPEAFDRGLRAVQEALNRRGIVAEATRPPFAVASKIGVFEAAFPDNGPRVTIIIPTKNRVELLKVVVASLEWTTYRNYDVLIVDNESDDPATLSYLAECGARVLRVASPPDGFSFSHIVNAGVRAASGDYVLLLNNDTEVLTPRWLSQMMGYARMPGVGAVGARLIYEDGRLQHGGIVQGVNEGLPGHCFKLLPSWAHGYLNMALVSREVSGVTAACLLVSKGVYERLGGLDESDFRVAYNDVDFCYRLVDGGYDCIQCASAELHHFEGKSRGFGDNPAEERRVRERYSARTDPFYNPNLSLANEQFEIERHHEPMPLDRPVRVAFVSHNLNNEGAPNSLFELSSGLKAVGAVDPVVLSPSPGDLSKRYAETGIEVTIIDHPWAGSPAKDEFEDRLRRLGQSFLYAGVDVVVANTADSYWAVAAARLVGLPSLFIIRESSPWQSYYANLPAYASDIAYGAFASAYRVVFVARATLDAWKPLDSRHNFGLVRNGLDASKLIDALASIDKTVGRTAVGAEPEDCVFTCVGTITERKGQLDVVRAFGLLKPEVALRVRLVLVGDRPSDYSRSIKEAVERLPGKLRDRVTVIPETPDAKRYLVGADVAVCTSRIESYPRVVLEAMAAGLPLVTTGVWGIREQVRAGYNALVYEPGDVQALAEHMTTMASDQTKRKLFADRAVPVFGSLPNFTFMRDSYAALIRQAVGSV